MKAILKLAACVSCLAFSTPVHAFTLTLLHSFAVAPNGSQPESSLVLMPNGLLYGTTELGGTNGGGGVIFSFSTNGTVSNVYSLNGFLDGNTLLAGLLPIGTNVFYGCSYYGGSNNLGVVYQTTASGAFSVLYDFGSVTNSLGTPLDGSNPDGDLLRGGDGNLYGTTVNGGANGFGTVFRISTNGVLTTLYSFGASIDVSTGTALDGSYPEAGLVQGADGALYSTTYSGGVNDLPSGGDGTIFRITTNGAFSTIYSFGQTMDGSGNPLDGGNPFARLFKAPDGSLYGTTSQGGTGASGTIFQFLTNGSLTSLYSFTGANDGAEPESPLSLASDGCFYGSTSLGGTQGVGTVFKLTNSSGLGILTTLIQFTGPNGSTPFGGLTQALDGNLYGAASFGGTNDAGVIYRVGTNGSSATVFSFPQVNDGANPSADLLLSKDGFFYGTTEAGGTFGDGTIFRMSSSGNLTLLHTFGSDTDVSGDNLDGAAAEGVLIQGLGGGLYGTTPSGGISGDGTIYRITTNGNYSLLHAFSYSDGATSWSGLLQTSNGLMYGTTTSGGASGNGTIYQVTTNGTLATLYSFTGGTDGATPYGGLALGPDGLLYGTTLNGGLYSEGTVYKTDTNGNISTIYQFTGGTDGAGPEATLSLGADGLFRGTTSAGGNANNGTVFSVTTNGSLVTLAQFNGDNGSTPLSGVVRTPDGSVYGTTTVGGASGNGVIYQITTNGAINSISLDGITGSYPDSGVVLGSDGNLYTLAENGGFGGFGSIFRVNLVTPQPMLQRPVKSGNSILLSWTAVANQDYQLQYITNLTQTNWSNVGSPLSTTNVLLQTSDTPGADPQRFYRVITVP